MVGTSYVEDTLHHLITNSQQTVCHLENQVEHSGSAVGEREDKEYQSATKCLHMQGSGHETTDTPTYLLVLSFEANLFTTCEKCCREETGNEANSACKLAWKRPVPNCQA